MLTHVLLVLMIQQAVSTNINVKISVPIDDCIPTGESKGGLIDPCEGNPVPAINTKCCSPKDKSHCELTRMPCDNMGKCTCKPEEENDDCIPTGESKRGLIDPCEGDPVPAMNTKCCSPKDKSHCVQTYMSCGNMGKCTCKPEEENDNCIPTGQTQSDIVKDFDGICEMLGCPEVKCCSAKDQISCVYTWIHKEYIRSCTCKAKEDNDDECIPTGETKEGIVDDIDGNIIMKCCSSRAEISCTSTDASGHNSGACTCK